MVARHHAPPERLSEEYFAAHLRLRASAEATELGSALDTVGRFGRSAVRNVLAQLGVRGNRTTARLELVYG